ncbi:MAG: shikimate dehydrogenase, partial [Oscillospiraceae bacterium]|nr:shikimate dehydrogenase [Oscillospiraceae bacterium]
CENIFDAIYNPNETVLVKTAKKLGKNAVGGMSMLVLQAVAAHEIWYGAKFTKQQTEDIIKEASEAVKTMF